MNYVLNSVIVMTEKKILSEILEKIYYASSWSIILCIIVTTGIYMRIGILIEAYFNEKKKKFISYAINVSIIVYIIIILLVTLLSRNIQMSREISIVPFSYLDSQDKIRGNLMNILLFYPLGILSGTKWRKKRCILLGTLMSLVIEISQYFWNLGYAEVDDVINNTMGMALGVSVMLVFEKVYLHYDKNRRKLQ